MKLYLVSNNSLCDNLKYDFNTDLEKLRMIRPLSVQGEEAALKISKMPILKDVDKIYSSFFSSAIATAKYLKDELNLELNLSEELNDCKVGYLGSKSMSMLKGMQDREFTYKLNGGESLVDIGLRLDNFIKKLNVNSCVLFTHKRIILGYLLKYCKFDYNLDENLIVLYHDQVIYEDSDSLYDIYEIELEDNKIVNIGKLS